MAQNNINLQNDPVKKTFYRYLMPAIVGMVIKALYIMIDTIFIGRGVGADGLAAVSITVPLLTFIAAISIMIGIGGSALMSIEFGKGNYKAGQKLLTQSILVTIIILGAMTLVGGYLLEQSIALLGATGNIALLSNNYMDILLQYSVVFGLGLTVSCFVRNDTNPRLTMNVLVVSALANGVFNYLFIFVLGWGIEGAAYGTVMSYILTLILLLWHFIGGFGHLRFSLYGFGLDKVGSILKTGLPAFFSESSATAAGIAFNLILLSRGNLYVSAYGIVLNTSVLTLFTLLGIGMACQPILSLNHGAGAVDKIRQTLSIGLKYAVATGIGAFIIVLFFSQEIAGLFTVDNPGLIDLASSAMKWYFLAYPLMGLNIIVATLFQSIGQSNKATVLSVIRGFILVAIGLTVMPMLMPENGVWLGILFAECVTAIISLPLLAKYLNLLKQPSHSSHSIAYA